MTRTNLLMGALVLGVCVLNALLGERITRSEGLGWDGESYRRVTVHMEGLLGERKLSPYYLGRVMPCAVVYLALRAARLVPTTPNVIGGFACINVLLLTATAFLWGLVAGSLKVSRGGKWLGLASLFISYAVLKQSVYYPVLTDVWAMPITMAMLAAYLRRRPFLLALLTLGGAFTSPLLLYIGAVLLAFPPASARADPPRLPRLAPTLLAGVVGLAAGGIALAVHYRIGYRGPFPVEPPTETVVVLSALLLALYAFLASKSLIVPCLHYDRKILTRERLVGGGLALGVLVMVKVSFLVLARGPQSEPATGTYLLMLPELAIARPLVFAVAHVLYFGPIVLLAGVTWRSCGQVARSMGWAVPILLMLGVALSFGSESRWMTPLVPFLVAVTVAAVDARRLPARAYVVFVGAALLLSKVWMSFNVSQALKPGAGAQMCLELYFASHGPWMTERMYLIQAPLVAALTVVLWWAARSVLPGPAGPGGDESPQGVSPPGRQIL